MSAYDNSINLVLARQMPFMVARLLTLVVHFAQRSTQIAASAEQLVAPSSSLQYHRRAISAPESPVFS